MLPIAIVVGVVAGLALGRVRRPLAYALAAATVAAVVVVAMLPISALFLGGGSEFELLAPVAAWVVGLAALSAVVGWLTRRDRPWLAGVVGVLGAILILTSATALHVMEAVSAANAPREFAHLWYLVSVVSIDLDLGGQQNLGSYYVRDVVESLPIVLTAVLAFVLACVHQTARVQSPSAQLTLIGRTVSP